MTTIELLDFSSPTAGRSSITDTENWYAEPFTKRTGCKVPGQCGGDCNCGCPYNTMTEVERLPLIDDIARIFPNEWLAFILSPEEDEEYEPRHGKMVAHSPDPDEIHDAVNTVLWNQHVYVFFNGDFEQMQASYESGDRVKARPAPKKVTPLPPAGAPLADSPLELIYSAIDHLYGVPNLSEAIRRLRLARVKAAAWSLPALVPVLDAALDKLETANPLLEEIIWNLEEVLADLETD